MRHAFAAAVLVLSAGCTLVDQRDLSEAPTRTTLCGVNKARAASANSLS